jgi:hemerythrin-like domain-containing protein
LKKGILLFTIACMFLLIGCIESSHNQGIDRERYDSLYEEKEELRYVVFELQQEIIKLENEASDLRSSLINFAAYCDKHGLDWANDIETFGEGYY